MRSVMSGNEAIARGIWEGGAKVATAYPGTPSTEILENVCQYPDLYSEWSVNEKVAVEVAIGASSTGARAVAAMKLVGLNVAADPLFNASYIGVRGGLVIITADDPGRHSSQTEQDNRNYGRFAKCPVLEPADSQECKDFMILAFALSEELNTPVLLRTTTRTSHSKGLVELGERAEPKREIGITRDIKYSLLPAFTRSRPKEIWERLARIKERVETLPINYIEMGDPALGILAGGAAYQYAREAFPGASFMKVGTPFPLPVEMARDFRARVKKLVVVEELDPLLEEQLKLAGITPDGGAELLPRYGELDPYIVANALSAAGAPGAKPSLLEVPAAPQEGLPLRPPTLCPGCGHRGVFSVLSRLKLFVSGDIGCYTLGALPPFSAMNSDICMGASISTAHGIQKALGEESFERKNRKVSVIGDSTFFHSGITGLLNIVWNNGSSVIIILDNRTTAMTGGQETPATGKTLSGTAAPALDIAPLCRALGVPRVEVVDPYDLEAVEKSITAAIDSGQPSVIVAQAPCVLQYKIRMSPAWVVDLSACTACKRCLRVGCTALSLLSPDGQGKQKVAIEESLCIGCGVCAQLCRAGAIGPQVAQPAKA